MDRKGYSFLQWSRAMPSPRCTASCAVPPESLPRSPTYTTHSSSEAAHAGLPPVCYPLNPRESVVSGRGGIAAAGQIQSCRVRHPDHQSGQPHGNGLPGEASWRKSFPLPEISICLSSRTKFTRISFIMAGHKGKSLSEVIGECTRPFP